jgi:hypothetical protein
MKIFEDFKNRKYLLGIISIALIACVLFILKGLFKQEVGFPLDDAWIHQTYARNLILQGRWSYSAGTISGGSTSPFWTLLLSLGYLFSKTGGITWAFLLSICSFVLLELISCLTIFSYKNIQNKWQALIPGVLIAGEWHLLWSAASGMETTLFSLGIVFVIYQTLKEKPVWWLIGLISGILVWIRPDGLTLLGPIFLIFCWGGVKKEYSWNQLLSFLVPFLVLIGCYIIFNLLTTRNLFPNTFYAKQVEYQELLKTPLFTRFINELTPLLAGSGILILPGFAFEIWQGLRSKNIKMIAFLIWIVGFIFLYALRLPVTYQHGRYIFPIIAPFFIFGIVGIFSILERINSIKSRNLITTAWMGSLILITAAFYAIGINTYQSDLKIINQLMVQPAKWTAVNLPQEDIIAVHDIGAMGYFTQNKIIDLAGLVNPEVIPLMHDEKRLLEYMQTSQANYFIGFSDWYETSNTWGKKVMTFSAIYQNKQEEIEIIQLKK